MQEAHGLVELASDADQRAWSALRRALARARVKILMRGLRDDGELLRCRENPLARGCN